MTLRFGTATMWATSFVCAFAFAGALAQSPAGASADPRLLSVGGRTNANVSLAANGSVVAAAWAASLPGGATDIYTAVSRDNAATFGTPVRVNEKIGDAHVTGEQPPRVVLRSRAGLSPEVIVVWTSKGNAGGTIVSARSSDLGKTFGATTVIPGGEGLGNRGWENITVDGAGQVHVVWLDHRELAASASMTHMPEHHAEPAASSKDAVDTSQRSKLYASVLGDSASVRAITGGVCYCCKTAIVAGPDHDLYLAWRHVYPQNMRDMAFTESHDGGRTFSAPVRISEDKWQIEGCPEDGPALALDAQRHVHVAWPTLVNDGPDGRPSIGIFYAVSNSDHRFGARQRVATEGVPHHPQMAIARGSIYLAWDELKNGARQVVLARRALTDLTAPWSRTVLSGNAPGTYPSLAATDGGLVVAWASSAPTSAIRVITVKF